MTSMTPSTFKGFPVAATQFFKELALNQNRQWFSDHTAEHEQFVNIPMVEFMQAVNARLASTHLPLRGDPRQSISSINRNMRFSADKSPYKTYASAVWSRDGKKASPGLVYFQFGADEIFAAAGFYMPSTQDLYRLRAGMAWDQLGWLSVRKRLDRQGLTLMTKNALLRVPKKFESSAAVLHDDLRLRSWVISRSYPLGVARCSDLVGAIAELALSSADLLEFGWSALEDE
jgi:uncharacterized protein (TIGR02453 family)